MAPCLLFLSYFYFNLLWSSYNIAKLTFDKTIGKLVNFYNSIINNIDIDHNDIVSFWY